METGPSGLCWAASRSDSPDHGPHDPGPLPERRDGLVHQRMGLDKVQHLVGEGVGGIEAGPLDRTAPGPGHTASRRLKVNGACNGDTGDAPLITSGDGRLERFGPSVPGLGDGFICNRGPNGLGGFLLLEPPIKHAGQLLHVKGAHGRARDAAAKRGPLGGS